MLYMNLFLHMHVFVHRQVCRICACPCLLSVLCEQVQCVRCLYVPGLIERWRRGFVGGREWMDDGGGDLLL